MLIVVSVMYIVGAIFFVGCVTAAKPEWVHCWINTTATELLTQPHCHIVTLSLCHSVTLSHCHMPQLHSHTLSHNVTIM
jgi:hypothetical protein